jgi:hypothetical protein
MDQILLDAAAGFAAGGVGQIVSNFFKTINTSVNGLSQAAIQNRAAEREEARKDTQQFADNYAATQEAARNRFPGWLTGTVFILIVLSAFWGIYLAGFFNMPTSIVEEKEPWLNLFGILKVGGGWAVHAVEGLAIPDYFSRGVIMVLSAITAIKAFKTS